MLSRQAGGDGVGDVAVQAVAGVLWRTQVSQLSECPLPASESSRHNPFSSSMRS
jgi:hypothetical protein